MTSSPAPAVNAGTVTVVELANPELSGEDRSNGVVGSSPDHSSTVQASSCAVVDAIVTDVTPAGQLGRYQSSWRVFDVPATEPRVPRVQAVELESVTLVNAPVLVPPVRLLMMMSVFPAAEAGKVTTRLVEVTPLLPGTCWTRAAAITQALPSSGQFGYCLGSGLADRDSSCRDSDRDSRNAAGQ